VDLFDREAVFIETQLIALRRDLPELKIVVEHITTKDAAHYVRDADRFVAATITAHHLLYNRNAIFLGGIRPHHYCLPVLKREVHRVHWWKRHQWQPKFFLGTDSAPHAAHLRHATGCAAFTPRTRPWNVRRGLRKAGALDSSRASPASMARTSTACRATPARSRCG
jgi:dihydroorotase